MRSVRRLGFLLVLALLAAPAGAVDYTRLSPAEFAEDLVTAGDLVAEGLYTEALALLEALVDDEPKDADALSLLGYTVRKLGDLERAERVYERALAVDPSHAGALQYLGELYVERGDLVRARAQLERLDAVCPSPCQGRAELAAALGRQSSALVPSAP